MNTQDLIQRCHEAAKDKGFWDKERNQSECFALIISELYEGLEAHRKGKFAKVKLFELVNLKETFKDYFEFTIKDTFEDELADILIRLFDFCGGYNVELTEYSKKELNDFYKKINETFKKTSNIAEKILIMTDMFVGTFYLHTLEGCVDNVFHYTMYLCQQQNIDIETHIELKLRYNATRAKLHGKKY